jgi:TIR domain-containing protein
MISYRRADSAGWANHLAENLRSTFGSPNVFLDIESIEPGLDFVGVLERQLDTCDVVLAIIGPSWLHSAAEGSRSRLDDEHDFVRLELSRALRRGIRLIPILVGGAVLPPPAELPSDLADLVRRQAFELSDTRWSQDVARLSDVLKAVQTDPRGATIASSIRVLALAALAMVIVGGAAGAATIHFNLLVTPPSGPSSRAGFVAKSVKATTSPTRGSSPVLTCPSATSAGASATSTGASAAAKPVPASCPPPP